MKYEVSQEKQIIRLVTVSKFKASSGLKGLLHYIITQLKNLTPQAIFSWLICKEKKFSNPPLFSQFI